MNFSNGFKPCLSLFVVSVLSLVCVYAFRSYGYSHDRGVETYRYDWMKPINDKTLLKHISMPGTHGSLSLYGGWAVETQTKSLKDQLNSGIRAFDVRCRHFRDSLPIHHGRYYQNTDLFNVMLTMNEFLDNHPSEVLLMRIKQEYKAAENKFLFEYVFDRYMKALGRRVWVPDNNELTIGKVRGKIVILQDFVASKRFGLSYGSFDIQDNYHLRTNWDLYSKWERVKNQLKRADSSYGKSYFMNYLSGSGGSFPYFVASGNSDPGTHSPNLLTGRTTPGWKNSYPDFPRQSCFIGICSIAFEGTNHLTTNYLKSLNRKTFVGIIMSDFPGDVLIELIIKLNFK